MIASNGIVIKNIFVMLAYAYKCLRHDGIAKLDTEKIDHVENLLARLLHDGLSHLVKQGLHRDYQTIEEDLSTARGRILLGDTIRHRVNRRLHLACETDHLTSNTLFNRILKSAAIILMNCHDVSEDIRVKLRHLLSAFDDIDPINLGTVNWQRLHINRCTPTYELLLNVSWMVHTGLIQNEAEGRVRLENLFNDEKLYRLYERFILNYFQIHHPHLHPRSKVILWDLPAQDPSLPLPKMQCDVMLTHNNHVLIIDAKFYAKSFQSHYGKDTFLSGNLYQIMSYVTNYQAMASQSRVSGMLLYAQTTGVIQPNHAFNIHGHDYAVRTLDLGKEFPKIRSQLDGIANKLMLER